MLRQILGRAASVERSSERPDWNPVLHERIEDRVSRGVATMIGELA
jgi:hypothetical protein